MIESVDEAKNEIQIKEYSHGKRGWLIVMVIFFIIHSIVDNYTRYGVIQNPIDVIFYVNNMIIQHIWLVCLTLLFYSMQIFLIYVIEKLLEKKYICERLGMTLHAFNVFSVSTAYIIVAIKNNINPLISRLILTYTVYTMTKVWSYAFVNYRYRKFSKNTADNLNKNVLKIPSKVYNYNQAMMSIHVQHKENDNKFYKKRKANLGRITFLFDKKLTRNYFNLLLSGMHWKK